ncbi:MAG: PDZ domain-containing protein [Gemmataceae bacterium]|nr:PDZ domain-containing protein [Gemmataceae bacterium]
MDCSNFDAQVVRQDKQILDMANQFVFLRIVKLNGANLNLFRFDYDLTWMSFFLDADGRVYSRYGGRDATSAESRLSAAGLLFTMKEVLRAHKDAQTKKLPPVKVPPPSTPDELPMIAARLKQNAGQCIHCHQVNEANNALAKQKGSFKKEGLYLYPLPETAGLTLDRVEGNRIKAIETSSAAAKAGLKAGDVLRSANGVAVLAAFDLQAALHDVGADGKLSIEAERDGKPMTFAVQLSGDWRRGDISWRKSIHHMQPRIPGLFGRQMNADEKAKIKVPEDGLAWQITNAAGGLQKGDVVVAVDGKRKVPYLDLRGYFPLECKSGDKVELVVLRDGKETPATLKLP